MLKIKNLNITLRASNRALLQGFSIELGEGEVLAIRGPSGSGKSTLLAFLAGFINHHTFKIEGDFLLFEKETTHIPIHQRGVGMLTQDYLLFPHFTVAENIAFAMPGKAALLNKSLTNHRLADNTLVNKKSLNNKPFDRSEKKIEKPFRVKEEVKQLLAEAGLDDTAQQYPESLSGGEKARVALLCALASKPRYLLLDEPFSRLDPSRRAAFRRFVYAYLQKTLVPTVMVTHDEADLLPLMPLRNQNTKKQYKESPKKKNPTGVLKNSLRLKPMLWQNNGKLIYHKQ